MANHTQEQSPHSLVKKYNRQGPRYTSYPPVPYWRETPTKEQWSHHLKQSYSDQTGIDLYIHIPFCESLCSYCGCSRIITRNHSIEDEFIQMLLKEWSLLLKLLNFTPLINSLHFGGGTPTFLKAQNLDFLLNEILKTKSENFIGSIEIDPRQYTDEHLSVLNKHHFSRFSLGIQDFNPEVQKKINRLQSPLLVENLVKKIRAQNSQSINFDLIYGLPGQNEKTIEETLEIVINLAPDMIAFYSYAHLPERFKNQRLINPDDLPSPETKRALYDRLHGLLIPQGYEEIGLDHFALKNHFLVRAKAQKKLHRNFMGYVDKKSPILIGLGPTSISDSSLSFIQNAKDLKEYKELLNKDQLPFTKGHIQSATDLRIQKIILDLLCHGETELYPSDLNEALMLQLDSFENDGLISRNDHGLVIRSKGKPFARNIAMAFDYHFQNEKNKANFSQTI